LARANRALPERLAAEVGEAEAAGMDESTKKLLGGANFIKGTKNVMEEALKRKAANPEVPIGTHVHQVVKMRLTEHTTEVQKVPCPAFAACPLRRRGR
jgi:hypothetical protein